MIDEKKLLFTNDHEWVKIDGDSAYVGITDHAQSELGDIIFIEFPEVGDRFSSNDVFGTIEAVKTVADLFMPLDCEVIEFNELLDTEPEKINLDPYSDGWIVKVKLLNKDNIKKLLSYDEYQKLL